MKIIDHAIDDDIRMGDAVSNVLIDPGQIIKAVIYTKQDCLVAGISIVCDVFDRFGVTHTTRKKDGVMASKGDVLLELNGNARMILSLERPLLNVLGRMSGIATKTHAFCLKAGAPICTTRKAAPGCLRIDQTAIKIGGGLSYGDSTFVSTLVKDHHIACFQAKGMTIEQAFETAIKQAPKPVEIEAFSFEKAKLAAKCGADTIVLDKFPAKEASKTIKFLRKNYPKVRIGVSGGITAQNIKPYAALKPDLIFMSCLTIHSKPTQISLKILPNA